MHNLNLIKDKHTYFLNCDNVGGGTKTQTSVLTFYFLNNPHPVVENVAFIPIKI